MNTHLPTRLTAILLLLSVVGLSGPAHAQAAGTTDNKSYMITWNEGPHIVVAEYWNAPSRAGCDYAANPWPQAQLAAERAYVLGARQVLRDEWDIGGWISQNRPASQARIHGAETNCPNQHFDYPPHVHVFDAVTPAGSSTWQMLNSHHHMDARGKIYDNLVIPSICGQNQLFYVADNTWLGMLDEACTAVWQQRYTAAGDLELRRSATAPVYTLRSTGTNGDLSSLDVLLSGAVVYRIDITEYDPIAFHMVAKITDTRKNTMATETWTGDPVQAINLTAHTVQTTAIAPTPNPISTPSPGDKRLFVPLIRH